MVTSTLANNLNTLLHWTHWFADGSTHGLIDGLNTRRHRCSDSWSSWSSWYSAWACSFQLTWSLSLRHLPKVRQIAPEQLGRFWTKSSCFWIFVSGDSPERTKNFRVIPKISPKNEKSDTENFYQQFSPENFFVYIIVQSLQRIP